MATISVPAVNYVICDACCRRSDHGGFRKAAKLRLKRHALDSNGDLAGDATVEFDLCDYCEEHVSYAINRCVAKIKEDSK